MCSFAARQFLDQFRRVLCHCGSFVNIRGGHNWPFIERMTERRPLRVFMQSGAADGVLSTGDWPLANQTMAYALANADYDHRFK